MILFIAPIIAFFWARTFLPVRESLELVISAAVIGGLIKMLIVGPSLAEVYRLYFSRVYGEMLEGRTLSEAVISGPYISICTAALLTVGIFILVRYEVLSQQGGCVCIFLFAANELIGYVASFTVHQRRSLLGVLVALAWYGIGCATILVTYGA